MITFIAWDIRSFYQLLIYRVLTSYVRLVRDGVCMETYNVEASILNDIPKIHSIAGLPTLGSNLYSNCPNYWRSQTMFLCGILFQKKHLHRWRWLGHVLRKPSEDMAKVALKWTPEGKRKRGRPKTTWRCTIENEIKERGYSWGTIERKANNREEWKELVLTLCAMRHSKD